MRKALVLLLAFPLLAAKPARPVRKKEPLPPLVKVQIGTTSVPSDAEVALTLTDRFQLRDQAPTDPRDHYDPLLLSPKSVRFSPDGKKLYVNALQGGLTLVYDVAASSRVAAVVHQFKAEDAPLFSTSTLFPAPSPEGKSSTTTVNVFSGLPVESAFTHGGRYLWVPYYRRSTDPNAERPSAIAVVDTASDTIVRVLPTGILPKMVAASPDGKYVAVTHWGANTVGLIDVSSSAPAAFAYVRKFVAGQELKPSFNTKEKVDRDVDCGFCLRGTAFTPDSRYLLVGRMGGDGIDVFDVREETSLGLVRGMRENIRHLEISGGNLYVSANKPGVVQKASLEDLLAAKRAAPGEDVVFSSWTTAAVGTGARTISVSPDGRYVFAAVNETSQVVAVRTADMAVVARVGADSYPVGMDISPDGKILAVTSQGRDGKGGHSLMLFRVDERPAGEKDIESGAQRED